MTTLWIPLLLTLWTGQTDSRPAYVREGDRIENQFRIYHERLDRFYATLLDLVAKRAPELKSQLEGAAPPAPSVYGYQLLPRITDNLPVSSTPVSSFSYSWPITQSYVDGEGLRLERNEDDLRRLETASNTGGIQGMIRSYQELLNNQRTVDQYIEYNRFWQRSIAMDRPRFDALTTIYNLMKSGAPTTGEAVREALGKPDVPSFIKIIRNSGERTLIRIPVYTDIRDKAFLEKARAVVEDAWNVSEPGMSYALEIDFRSVTSSQLYRGKPPVDGAHIDLTAHAAQFPADGAVLTTGAESTHSIVGRYLALGPGDLSGRTLAHEFGHLLGFRDGYIRGYRDLGERGFEILELTTAFDDIMSAPRDGHVQTTHFKLIVEGVKGK